MNQIANFFQRQFPEQSTKPDVEDLLLGPRVSDISKEEDIFNSNRSLKDRIGITARAARRRYSNIINRNREPSNRNYAQSFCIIARDLPKNIVSEIFDAAKEQ